MEKVRPPGVTTPQGRHGKGGCVGKRTSQEKKRAKRANRGTLRSKTGFLRPTNKASEKKNGLQGYRSWTGTAGGS